MHVITIMALISCYFFFFLQFKSYYYTIQKSADNILLYGLAVLFNGGHTTPPVQMYVNHPTGPLVCRGGEELSVLEHFIYI